MVDVERHTMKTTLNVIRSKKPCAPGWEKLLKGLGKTVADDEPLDFDTIVEINGVDDAIWCFCAIDGETPLTPAHATAWMDNNPDQKEFFTKWVAERYKP